ncbi:hypothetical protein OHJ16_04840 [Actinomyces israelii]|uniref:Uncharacterized protein n=1 Tax=Actinomyces israelii TaxID=1659 RepID=A0ABT4I6J9_9ACTO|nr:hypothetical protein [Actinomyces israelii]MCZ0857369.1 hypothetical protein [Actinomyces israelii]
MRAHRLRREVPLDAGHQVPVGHHLTQMLGRVVGVAQHLPRPDDTPDARQPRALAPKNTFAALTAISREFCK